MLDFKKVLSRFKVNKYFIILLIVCLIIGYSKQVILLFLFVILHEMSHLLFAKIYKLKINNIEIFPFGGVARIDNLDNAGVFIDIVITIAGPLFNLATAMVLFFLKTKGIMVDEYLITVNLTLGLFNLLPGMPLDGGRILRALLSYFVGFKKAFKATIVSGKIIAVIIFSLGLLLLIYERIEVSLLTMPFFLYISAKKEQNAGMFVIIKDIINKGQRFKHTGVMEGRDLCVYHNTNVCDILKYFDYDKYHIIFVIGENMGVECILTESEVFDNLSAGLEDTTIGELCERIKSSKTNSK